jgi:hypothetical protein
MLVRVVSYSTNFWVINVHLYLELPYLLTFFAMVDASHGTYLYRWGDAPLIYLALAIGAKSEDIAWMLRSWSVKASLSFTAYSQIKGSRILHRMLDQVRDIPDFACAFMIPLCQMDIQIFW